jgi:hypothetical protein
MAIEPRGPTGVTAREYPLQQTAAMLNDRLGLYLSAEQQRGLATGLLVGAALGAAVISWSVVGALRGNR